MKASELINELNKLISTYGDLEVYMPDSGVKSIYKDHYNTDGSDKAYFMLEEE